MQPCHPSSLPSNSPLTKDGWGSYKATLFPMMPFSQEPCKYKLQENTSLVRTSQHPSWLLLLSRRLKVTTVNFVFSLFLGKHPSGPFQEKQIMRFTYDLFKVNHQCSFQQQTRGQLEFQDKTGATVSVSSVGQAPPCSQHTLFVEILAFCLNGQGCMLPHKRVTKKFYCKVYHLGEVSRNV